tara:strand:- start:1376 stop:1936 length:561 start_codon:yes stop_codon:yes gene_type:complete
MSGGMGGGDGGVAEDLLTTKGDTHGYTTENARVPISATNGHVLTSNSGTALGLEWAAIPAAATIPEMVSIAMGDETTVLAAASTTVPLVTFNMPYGFTLTNVIVSAVVAPTGAALVTVDVHENGTTVLSTKVTIDASEKTSATAVTQPVISDSALAVNSLIEIFVDQIDTDNVAAGLKIYLIGNQT